jgi:S-adenosylmethionine uptake transporter
MQALWMVLGAFFFASMAVCVKYASSAFSSAELVFWRGLIGMGLLWGITRHRRVSLATAYPGMHAWRSLVGVISLGAWFHAIAWLPLATALTLNYLSSVWIAAFVLGGTLLAWERCGATALRHHGLLSLTILAGFAGVVMMLRPGMDGPQVFAGLMGLLSGLLSALAYIQVTALGRLGEPDSRIVFYFTAGSAAGGAVGMLLTGVSPWIWSAAAWLPAIAVLAALGQLCMTRAFSQGSTLVVASLQYLGIVFAGLYSVLLFDEQVPLVGWLGMALIVASGIAATVLRARAASTPSQEP